MIGSPEIKTESNDVSVCSCPPARPKTRKERRPEPPLAEVAIRSRAVTETRTCRHGFPLRAACLQRRGDGDELPAELGESEALIYPGEGTSRYVTRRVRDDKPNICRG